MSRHIECDKCKQTIQAGERNFELVLYRSYPDGSKAFEAKRWDLCQECKDKLLHELNGEEE